MKKLKEKITKVSANKHKIVAGSLVLTAALAIGLGFGLGFRPKTPAMTTEVQKSIIEVQKSIILDVETINYIKEEVAGMLEFQTDEWLVVSTEKNSQTYSDQQKNYLLSFFVDTSVVTFAKIKGENQFEVSNQRLFDQTEDSFLNAVESQLMGTKTETQLTLQGDLPPTEWEIARNFLLKVASQHNIVVPQIVVAHAWNENGFLFEFLINGAQNDYAYKRVSIAVFKWSHQSELNAYSVRFWKNAIYGDFAGSAGIEYIVAHDSSDAVTANELVLRWVKNMQHNAPFSLAKKWGVNVVENQLVFWRGKETLNRKLVLSFSLNKNEIIFNQQQALNFLKK